MPFAPSATCGANLQVGILITSRRLAAADGCYVY